MERDVRNLIKAIGEISLYHYDSRIHDVSFSGNTITVTVRNGRIGGAAPNSVLKGLRSRIASRAVSYKGLQHEVVVISGDGTRIEAPKAKEENQ